MEKFGNYRIDQKLGEGGMGVVYLATDLELERRVALKTLISGAEEDEERLARFLREAKAVSRLQHPSIVTMYHFGVEGSTRYLVMEYIEGKTLRKMISGQPLPISQMLDYAIQIADGLSLAHERGVIHRDLKAENVMVTPRGQVKILDFGLAKLKETKTQSGDEETAFRTEFGMVVGTVSTMSPEQAMGREVDARSDIFSLGVIFYQMATGKLPFEGPTPQATLALILNQEAPPVTDLNPEVPPELARLIQQCMQKSHVFRPSATDLVLRLKNIQASQGSGKVTTSDVRQPAGAPSMDSRSVTSLSITASVPAMTQPGSGKTSSVKTPAISLTTPSATAMQAAGAGNVASLKGTYYAIRIARIAFSILTLTVPLSYLLMFIIGGGLIRSQVIEGTMLMRYIQAVVTPALSLVDRIFTFRMVSNGWNFMLLILAVAAFVARHLIMLPAEAGEHWAKSRLLKARASAPQTAAMSVSDRSGSGSRLALLREYAETKKVLFQEKKPLAFMSVDVVGSTQMKRGEDKLMVEHAFVEFKKYVERILNSNNCWKSAWTPDGVMCAFRSAPEAVKAGQEVLSGLGWFNSGVHNLRTPFAVRAGVHYGEVVFPDNKDMVEVSDFTIDVTGHLQKHGSQNTLWVSKETVDMLSDTSGFKMLEQQIDSHGVFEWVPSVEKAAAQ
jgi:serine/threonine protein kinase/class 3 adenylate cyclase